MPPRTQPGGCAVPCASGTGSKLVIATCFLLASTTPVRSQEPDEERREALAPVVEGLAKRALNEGALGLVVAVELEGAMLYSGGFGFVDERRSVPAGPEAPFQVGALLPSFLAVAALRLCQDGKLDLDAPLGSVLPGLGYDERIRIDMLLTQTSGIPGYGELVEAKGALGRPLEPRLVLGWLAEGPLAAEPGSCVAYSNTNDLLLGLVLERSAKKPLRELLDEWVFAPAGMAATDWRASAPESMRAPLEQELGDAFVPDGTPAPFGAEGLSSTAEDLLRFQRALAKGSFLSEPMRSLRLETPELPGAHEPASARGFALTQLDELVRESAGGALGGCEVHLARFPAMDVNLVVLVRGSSAGARVLGTRVARSLFAFAGPEVVDLEIERERLQRYPGDYYAACTSYGIFLAGERLTLRLPSGDDHPLLYRGGETFVSASDPDLRVHFELANDRAVTLILTEHGVTLRAERVR